MKFLGIILTGIGLILSCFTFFLFTLEDYTPYADPIPLWPLFLGVILLMAGLICSTKTL